MAHILDGAAGFVIGCVVWNYFATPLKNWLHTGERAAGTAVKTEAQKLKDDITSKL